MADYPTLLDVTKALDPTGKLATIAEIMNETNEILDDIPWIEGNLPTGHRITMRTGLPEPTWRKLNQGVQPTKGTTAQVDESCGMLEAYAEVDKALADLNGNANDFRLMQDRGHIEGMSQEVASAIFYGDTAIDRHKILGLAPRFNTGDKDSAASAENVINGGGTGSDNTSIWLVGWGERSVHGIYPKGSKAGLAMNNKGQITVQNSDGSRMEAYLTHYKWDCGLAVPDWRYVVRIANVDVTALTKDASAGADLLDLMVQALERIQGLSGVRPAFYCSRLIRSYLRRQILNKSNVLLSLDEVAGKKVLSFDGVPIRRVDKLLNTEAAVTGF